MKFRCANFRRDRKFSRDLHRVKRFDLHKLSNVFHSLVTFAYLTNFDSEGEQQLRG